MSSKLTQAEEKWRNQEVNSTLIAELIKEKKIQKISQRKAVSQNERITMYLSLGTTSVRGKCGDGFPEKKKKINIHNLIFSRWKSQK